MSRQVRRGSARRRSQGFSYMLVLFVVAFMSVTLSLVGEAWSRRVERERTMQKTWIDKQYARARQRYYNSSPGTVPEWPRSTEDLLEDRRYLGIKRHLREDYRGGVGSETSPAEGQQQGR